MAWSIEIRNQLDVIPKTVIREFLILGGRECVRLNQRGCAPELEVAFQLQDESVDLEKRGLTYSALQFRQALQVMRIVPIDMPQVKVRPVRDAALRQVHPSVARAGSCTSVSTA